MFGKKIKELRLEKKMTQAELAKGIITRNMLSQIENDVASPSVSTACELAKRLNTPLAYFFADSGTLDDYRKMDAIGKIKQLYASKEYEKCLSKIKSLGVYDDETELIFTKASLARGIEMYRAGCLESARSYFQSVLSHAGESLYAGLELENTAVQYLEAISWIYSNGETKIEVFEENDADRRNVLADLAYIQAVSSGKTAFAYSEDASLYVKHLDARANMERGDFQRAAEKLRELTAGDIEDQYAVVKYCALRDLEICMSREGDYKSAYECASARLALFHQMNK